MEKPILNRLNQNLKNLPVYQPGRPIEEVAREIGLPVQSIIKLASNENPLARPPKPGKPWLRPFTTSISTRTETPII